MPLAVQYGMPLDEFWHGDMRLLEVYQKAYTRNVSYTAWLSGHYTMVAHSLALSNAFARKGAKQEEYPQWKDPIGQMSKPKITEDNIEEQHRNLQCRQVAFIASIINKSDGR